MRELILFHIGERVYALAIQRAVSLEKGLPLVRVPGAVELIAGMAAVLGEVVPVVDGKKLTQEDSAGEWIVLASSSRGVIGVTCDGAAGIEHVEESEITQMDVDYLEGVYRTEGKSRFILDIERIVELCSYSHSE